MTMNPNPPDSNLPPDRRRDDLAVDRTSGAWGWWILVAIIVIGFIWWIGWGVSGGWGGNRNNNVNAPVANPAPLVPPATNPQVNSGTTQPATQPTANNR